MEKSKNQHRQVISEIVCHDLCVGCGVCSGVCPSNILRMKWRDNGEIVPTIQGSCPSGCGLCLEVCPFGAQSDSEDRLAKRRFGNAENTNRDHLVGYYIDNYVGYSCVGNHRKNGASGGMATWLLESLLEGGHVDAVLCVGPSDKAALFAYQFVLEKEKVRQFAGSKYYPVHMADTVRMMNTKMIDRRYAIVGLPCYLKGLQLAMEIMPRLRRRIIYLLGLTCGGLPNRHYTEYLSYRSGIPPESLTGVHYRCKENTQRADNYRFRAFSTDGRVGRNIPFIKIRNIWLDGFFRINACNYCDDIFAELADVALMDAWLPEYQCDPAGHSLMVVRHPNLQELLKTGHNSGQCRLSSISHTRVAESQRGVIYHKRELLSARLFRAMQLGGCVPKKRCRPNGDTYKKKRRQIEARFAIQHTSKKKWMLLKSKHITVFHRHLIIPALPLIWNRWIGRLRRLIKKPFLLLRSLRLS